VELFFGLIGLVLVAAIVWEVFSDLFHPARTSALSDAVGRTVFGMFKRVPRSLPLAGPLALMSVIALWIAGLVAGFALVYFHAYPAGFRTSTGAIPPASSRVLNVLYFSFETLITLGYGDVVPHARLPRLAAATEGLIGFGLLTASVSWIVLLYPALSRMRLLARGVSHLVDAERDTGTCVAESGSDVVLSGLAKDVAHARTDLVHFPIIYYFASNDPKASIAMWMPDLARIADEARAPERPGRVRLAASTLDVALHELAAIVDARFLHTGSQDRAAIFDALGKDQVLDR
jgi:hypothetical protein